MVDLSTERSESIQRELLRMTRQMSAAMRYEPSYSEVVLSIPALGACVGRVGLLDDPGRQTVSQATGVLAVTVGDEALAVSGDETIASDPRLGPGASDVTRAYLSSRDEGPLSLGGIRSAFVADQPRSRCLLYNDKYGRERIFLHTSGTRLFFASEAKAILAVVPQTRAFDPTGLAEFVACGCTLGRQSLYRGIEVLEGGTILTLEGSTARHRRYFGQADWERLEPAAGDEFLEGFSASLRSAVNAQANGLPKAGISLTGGLDSRMIMASLDAEPGAMPCYTFGSMYRATGDVAVAAQVAALSGQPHHVIELGSDFLSSTRQCLERSVYISDGYLGLSGAAEVYLNQKARAIAPARITGNWGGELMRGVRSFKYATPTGGFISTELAARIADSAVAFPAPSRSPLSAALFQQMPFQGYGRYAIERSQVFMRSPFLADEVVKWLYRANPSARESSTCATSVIGRRPELLRIPTDAGLLGRGPEPLRQLRRTLRRAMIKGEYLTSHGAPHWLARAFASLPVVVENQFLGVDKFQHFRPWMRRELAGLLRDTLVRSDLGDLRAWFEPAAIRAVVDDHIAGKRNHTDEIDKLLTLATAQATLFVSRARDERAS